MNSGIQLIYINDQSIHLHEDPSAMNTIDTSFLHKHCRRYLHFYGLTTVLNFIFTFLCLLFYIYTFYTHILISTSLREYLYSDIHFRYVNTKGGDFPVTKHMEFLFS